MNIVEANASIINEAMLGTKQMIKSYYQEFPGLHPNNVRIGLFPPVQRYPAVSVSPRSSTFISYLTGNKYYCSRDFEIAFWVDQLTKHPEKVLYEYSHKFVDIIRNREEFTIEDDQKRKQAFNFELGTVAVTEEDLATNPERTKPGFKITIPVSFTSKNKIKYPNVEALKSMRSDWKSEEEVSMYLYRKMLDYKKSNLSEIRHFDKGQRAIPGGTGHSLLSRMDNSILEHYQLGVDIANLALRFEVLTKIDFREETLLKNLQLSEEVVQLLMIDAYVGGFAIDSFWQQVIHSIEEFDGRYFFNSSVVFLIRINDIIERKGV